MKTIAIFNTKGGVGKTTTTMFLAQCAHNAGATVEIWDTDPQRSLTTWAKIAQTPYPVHTVTEHTIPTMKGTSQLVLIDCPPGNESILQKIINKHPDLFIIPMKATPLDVERGDTTLQYLSGLGYNVLPLFTMVNKRTKEYKETLDWLNLKKIPQWASISQKQAYVRQSFSPITKTLEYETVFNKILEVI